jgi:hypothetical protein
MEEINADIMWQQCRKKQHTHTHIYTYINIHMCISMSGLAVVFLGTLSPKD